MEFQSEVDHQMKLNCPRVLRRKVLSIQKLDILQDSDGFGYLKARSGLVLGRTQFMGSAQWARKFKKVQAKKLVK